MGKKEPKKIEGQPVEGFDIRFEWHVMWVKLFDRQVELIQRDIARARSDDRVVVYLSCPISSRGGGYHGTNVDIAKHTQRRLMADWGHRFWILNPAQYQMQSKEGRELMRQRAAELKIDESSLRPSGGDYMRMWTRVLVEDDVQGAQLGRRFDAFYFLGPSDVRDFFSRGGAVTVTAGVEGYFARKFAMDPDFRAHYSVPGIKWDPDWEENLKGRGLARQRKLLAEWERPRKDFFRFYAVRASAYFSLGCHDEWNILRELNRSRLAASSDRRTPSGDVGDLIAGFFDGGQIDPGAAVAPVSPGYALAARAGK